MGIRHWVRKRLAEDAEKGKLPPGAPLLNAIFGREPPPTPHALGEYDARSYPDALVELLRRRQQVSDALMEMDFSSRDARVAGVPRLHGLLRLYPHPLVYEALVNAYVDEGRWEEARGVAFAARERRWECARSPFPEIRMETERLREWSPEEVDALRAEREGAAPAAT